MPRILALLVIAAITLSGCGSSAQKAATALQATSVAPGAVGDTGKTTPTAAASAKKEAATAQPATAVAVAPTPVPENTATPKPSPTHEPTKAPTPAPEDLKLTATGMGQERQQVAYAFEIENPNGGYAVESSQYQIAIYDKAGNVLKSDSGYLELLLPQQKLGVAGSVYLENEQVADHVEVQVKPGDFTPAEMQPGFSADNITYVKSSYSARVTGVLKSPYKMDITNVKVYAIGYDAAGSLIGGGYTYLNFIPAEGQAPVEMSVVTAGEPAKVEVYASLSGLSAFGGKSSGAAEAQNIKLLTKGYGQDGEYVGYAFIVENPNANVAIENNQYQVAAYAKDGSVLKSDDGYIELLLPGQKLGIGGDLMLPNKSPIDHFDVQIKPGDFTPAQAQPPLGSDKATYIKGDYSDTVTGVIKSPYDKDTSHVRASAIAYDAKGGIIGGGYTWVDFVPAGDETGVSIQVKTSGEPANVEIYAAVTGLSDLAGGEAQGSQNLALAAVGFGQQQTSASYGFLVENTNAGATIESSHYQVTAYAKDGMVIDTDSSYIELLLPSQKHGVAGSLSVPRKNLVIDHIVVQLRAGDITASDPMPSFTTEKAVYSKGSYSSKVTGIVKSPYQKDASNVRVNAIVYDATDKIVGGGFTYVDFVPAQGQAAAEVSVEVSGKPAKAELYAALSGLSELK